MKKRIKLLLLLLLLVFTLPLVACSDKPSEKVTDTTPTVEPTVEPTIEPTIEPTETPTPTYDVSKANMFDKDFEYDGKPHSITVNRFVPDGVTVEYTEQNFVDVGTYKVTAVLKDPNGVVLKTLEATVRIYKPVKDISNVSFDDAEYIWEPNKTYTLEAKNIPDGVRAEYENNSTSTVGSFTAKVKLYDTFDNELLKTISANLVVKYASINDEKVFTSKNVIADGSTHTITLDSTLSNTFKSVTYENNSASTQGIYYAKAIATRQDNTVIEYHAILTIDNSDDAEFNSYVDEMFVYFLNGDQSTLNIFMTDYEKFGFEHQDNTWSSYTPYTDEDYASDLNEIARLHEEFNGYDYSKLSFAQQISYRLIKNELESFDFAIEHPDMNFLSLNYIDQFGGSAADIPSTMEAYAIRSKEDIVDMINYIDSVHDAFMTYVDYAKDRARKGYPLTDFTIANMIDYLDGVSGRNLPDEEKTEYYLKAILRKKITDSKNTLALTDDEISNYLAQLDAAFDNFIQGHIDLAVALKNECMGLNKEKSEQFYLGHYGDAGKEVYEYLLRSRLGITMDLNDYIDFLETTMIKYMSAYSSLKAVGNSEAISSGEVKIIDSDNVYDLIEYLKEFAKTIVPDLAATPEIDVAYMDKTVTANTTTLAYYMKSPLDYNEKEYIHLNDDALGDNYLETIKTLAHEGYPGHLYAYVATKENPNLSNLVRVLTSTGHGEGWAKYVEIALGEYIGNQKNTEWKVGMAQATYWDLFIYNLYARLDVGINYEGWDTNTVYKYMRDKNLSVTKESAEDLLRTLSEMPSQYAPYGYGQSFFFELHDEAKSILGENYNEVEFNSMLLEHGWCGLSDLETYYQEYMKKKCFLLGISYNA